MRSTFLPLAIWFVYLLGGFALPFYAVRSLYYRLRPQTPKKEASS